MNRKCIQLIAIRVTPILGAAQRWIYGEFKTYSPRLEVSYDSFMAKKNAKGVTHDVDLANVVAVLPGVLHKNRYVLSRIRGLLRRGSRTGRQYGLRATRAGK
jgi:hypothetical protein